MGTAINKAVGDINGAIAGLGTKMEGLINGLKTTVDAIAQKLDDFFKKFDKLLKWLHFDRVLNVLILISNIHNGIMLSTNLMQSLVSMVNSVLTALGNAAGLRDVDDQPIDISPAVSGLFQGIVNTFIGKENTEALKKEWNKYNRIYQAAANLMYAVQSLNQSVISALEIVGSNVAKIGNALRKWGEVSESAFGWMNITPNFSNPFFNFAEKAENGISQVDMVAQETISAQQAVNEVGKAYEELQKTLSEAEDSKQGKGSPEAQKIKETETKLKTDSAAPEIGKIDTIKQEPDPITDSSNDTGIA